MRVAVTGATGFVGPHLVHELVGGGHEVVALSNVESADLGVPHIACDLTREWPAEVADVDAVVHLAGLSAVGPSFDDPQTYLVVNGAMVTTMCEALRTSGSRARVLVVSSGAVYDDYQEQPISESGATSTNSPYVISKLLTENLAAYYAGRDLDVLVARPFNHLGPGQRQGFLLPDLVAEAMGAAADGHPLRTGDLTTARDYTDVRDVARAYRLLLEADLGGRGPAERVFNVCSGRARPGTEVLDLVLGELDLADLPLEVDESRVRPNDPRSIAGSHARLTEVTGWRPEVDLETTVSDYVEELRSRVSRSASTS